MIPLKDTTALEKSNVEFVCELTIPTDKVQWFLNDLELRPDEHTEIISEGNVHKLILKDITVDDEGQVKVKVGEKTSTASLYVQGMSNFIQNVIHTICIK